MALSKTCDACKMAIMYDDTDALCVRLHADSFDLCAACGEGIVDHLVQLRLLLTPGVLLIS